VDPTTGAFTPLLSADNAPGFNFSSPHGVSFVADPPAGADKHGKSDVMASYADQASKLSQFISSFPTGAGEGGGIVIADAHVQHPVLAIPHG
jgi:hypothetical protein